LEAEIDAHIEHYLSLQPFQFCRLNRLELQQSEQHQTLVMELEHQTRTRQLLLRFEGVSGLEFLPSNFQPVPLFLEIIWIGERQWQGINYQVHNTEQDVSLSFYCREFAAVTKDADHA
jgi:hypothetical protein